MFIESADTEMTPKLLSKYINKHKALVNSRYKVLQDYYIGEHDILNLPKKDSWKPDNRVVVNFAKYIVDTMNGFFIGIPIKVISEDEKVNKYLEFLDQYNDQDDNNAELSKICSIYGKGFEMYYQDEYANIGITYLTPMDCFMIYDDSILQRPLYFVRYYIDKDKKLRGTWSDNSQIQEFVKDGEYKWVGEPIIHYFGDVPATEYLENEERQGIFENVLSMINAYNKAISEKANDVDYFADAYLKILGEYLDEEGIKNIRSNRIINFEGDAKELVVEFLQKPSGDTTQENLINRLERLIYQISMVANISDESFGTASGISLKYKLQAMSNLAKTKERKFISGMNRRYKLICSNPASDLQDDDWIKIKYSFTRNFPANVLEESDIAGKLAGITSKKTQLSVLSIIDNVDDEINKIEKEQEMEFESYPLDRLGSEEVVEEDVQEAEIVGKTLNGAQTQSLIAIMAQYSGGQLTEGQAINLISTAIGISKSEARAILNGEM